MAKTSKKEKESLKGMAKGELEKKLAAVREDLRSIRFKAEGAKPKNVREPRALKKQVARILTEMRAVNK